MLLDALYGEFDKFTNWITTQRSGFFVSAYANSTRTRNENFEKLLSELNVPVANRLGKALSPGSVVFLSTGEETQHRDFVTKAWTNDPIEDVLRRMKTAQRRLLLRMQKYLIRSGVIGDEPPAEQGAQPKRDRQGAAHRKARVELARGCCKRGVPCCRAVQE